MRVTRIGVEALQQAEKLITPTTNLAFGDINLKHLLYKTYKTLGCYSGAHLIGAVFFNDHPNIPSVPPWEWVYWLHNLYQLNLDEEQTVWIHLILGDDSEAIKIILTEFFMKNPFTEQILLAMPPKTRMDCLRNMSKRILPKTKGRPQSIYVVNRSDFLINYIIRRAIEEDNDDVVSILSPKLREMYGDYYLVDLLALPGRQVIVAEYQNQVVGVACLNDSVNYDLLNENFELICYNGLKKSSDIDSEKIVGSVESLSETFEESWKLNSFASSYKTLDDQIQDVRESLITDNNMSLVHITSSLLLMYLYEDVKSGSSESIKERSMYSSLSISVDETQGSDNTLIANNYPRFHGEPNAFVLELLSCLPKHERCLLYLYKASFECYPNKDCCLVTFPSLNEDSRISRYFARVIPKSNTIFPHELYVLHKNVLVGRMHVKQASNLDKMEIQEMLSTISHSEAIWNQYQTSLAEDTPYISYVLLNEGKIVGLATVSHEFNKTVLGQQYNLSSWLDPKMHQPDSYGLILNLVMSPIFQRLSKFFLRELHRFSDYEVLYYRIDPNTRLVSNVIRVMAPILPRELSFYPPEESFALFVSTKRHLGIPRKVINRKIVVVGGGETTVGFLESLLFPQKEESMMLRLTNLTVITNQGFCYNKVANDIRRKMMVHNGHLDYHHMVCINLRIYVNVVRGTLTGIDRKNKQITIKDQGVVPYDTLILLCGEQFQKPNGKPQSVPQNVFIINSEFDATQAFVKLKNFYNRAQHPIVVHGHYLESFCCLATLLECGVPPNQLIFILPPNNYTHISTFNNDKLMLKVLKSIQDEGVQIFLSYKFADWTMENEISGLIDVVQFQSKHHLLEIACSAVFLYDTKRISDETFRAITKAGLVFDGRLVIDLQFRTNDSDIFGGGNLTKFSRKYYADHLEHKYFNRYEIGTVLGQQTKALVVGQSLSSEKFIFKKPIVRDCRLPGSLHYLSITKPGKPVPLEAAMNKATYGRVYVTGSLEKYNFFRLHINCYGIIETITCLAKQEIEVRNLVKIWGKHQTILNNLIIRHDAGLIKDFFEFFKEPWCQALYHDRIDNKMNEISEMLEEENLDSCKESEDITLISEAVEDKMGAFLQENHQELPMYANSILLRTISQDVQNHPFFQNPR